MDSSSSGTDDEIMSILVDESLPLEDLTLPFPPRDVTVRRNVEIREKFTMGEEIGRGKFGIVYRCTDKETGRQLAAKFVATPRKDDKRDVEREVEIMNYLQHPGIIQIFDAFDCGKEMTLVMELVEGGELFDRVIEDDYILTEKACAIFMRQVCASVNFMHQKNVLHLDMKPENILCLSKTGNRIKIIDFGLARRYDPSKKLQVLFGTPEFVAPEVVNFDAIGYPTDMWSVGVIAYVLVSGLSPFMGDTDCETMANVTIAKYDYDDEAFDDVSDECKDFITQILIKDKSKRLTSTQALAHPWLNMRQAPVPSKTRSRQASLVSPEPPLQAAQVNLAEFVGRWLDHPSSPYAFSDSSAELVMSRAGSAASVGLCSPSRCQSLTTPELSSEEESSGDDEPLFRPEPPPKPAEHARLSNIRREESLKRLRGRLVHQASKEEHYITIDEVKTLKQQGSLDEMVAKVASLPSSRRGSVTQPPPPARLRTVGAADSSRPQTPSPLITQPTSAQQVERQPSPGAQSTVCDRVMREAAAALSASQISRQRLSPSAADSSPRQQATPGSPTVTGDTKTGGKVSVNKDASLSPRGLSRTASPLLDAGGGPRTKSKSPSPRPAPESSLVVPPRSRSRSRTPDVKVTEAEADTASPADGRPADSAAPATNSTAALLTVDAAKKPRKSKSKESVSTDGSATRRRRSKSPATTEAADNSLPPEATSTEQQKRQNKTGDQIVPGPELNNSEVTSRQRAAETPNQHAKTDSAEQAPARDSMTVKKATTSSSEAKPSSGQSTPESRTIKIQEERPPEKFNSMIFNLKPVKRVSPTATATVTTKAPGLGLVQLRKVPSSKSEIALSTKVDSEAAQVKLRRTRPSDPSLSSSRDRPVLTRQKADSGGSGVKKKSPTKHKPKHELDDSRTNSAEITPPRPSKNGRRPREHIIQIEVVGCAGPEEGRIPPEPLTKPSAEPALRKLRQALRTLSSGSSRSAPSSPYQSRDNSPERERRPAGLLLRSWHRDRLRAGSWTRGPTLLDFVSARLEEAAGWHQREQEQFQRLLEARRPLSPPRPPPAGRRLMRGPLDWARLGWSITD